VVVKILAVVAREILGSDDPMHVRLHQLLNEINLRKSLITALFLDINDRDDVFVVKLSEQLHFTQSAQAEHGVVERSNLLGCNLLSRRFVQSRTDSS
jgi:hypothetical protein